MMKKLFAVCLAFLLLTACGAQSDSADADAAEEEITLSAPAEEVPEESADAPEEDTAGEIQPESDTEPAETESAASSAAPAAQSRPAAQNAAPAQASPANTAGAQNTAPSAGTAAAEPAAQTQSTGPVCTISISCEVLSAEPERCSAAARAYLPEDGWILPEETVSISEGESVLDVLQRACRDAGVTLEVSVTPGYGGGYVEGIGSLYEFDGGALSGWMYSVNGAFPNYGCGQYTVQDGDVICWLYTCDNGADIGGSYAG